MGPRGAVGTGVEYSPLEQPTADRKPHGGRWLLWLPVVVAGAVLYVLNINSELHYHAPTRGHLAPMPMEVTPTLHKVSKSFLVDSAGCRLPALDPWDVMVRKYISKPKPVDCTSRSHARPLIASNRTALYVLEDHLPDYNISDIEDLECCYEPFRRAPKNDEKITKGDNCTSFTREVAVEEEFVLVECEADGVLVYEDYHAFVPRKPKVEERCANVSASAAAAEAPSVLLLGIDAVSRLNFHRQMPHTVKLLSKMGAIEMLGYNKVGDNTFPNLTPVLSGLSQQELRNVCWPEDNTPFDDCPFVWNDFRDAGYRTCFGEDGAWMGIFNYAKKGFQEQPTDYYMRPFSYTIEDKIGHTQILNAKLCVGSRLMAEVLLQYVSKFAQTFLTERYFALFWGASLSHDFLNFPSMGDESHVRFLRDMLDSGALQRTVLVVMSDHGIRWGNIRNTYQGRMEERLPFLFFVFPEWFRERYAAAVANVGRNARRLTTPFDLYETLRDLLRPAERLTQDAVRKRTQAVADATASDAGPPRGVSLFLEVPPDRTCKQAGIDPHWCTCQQSHPVDRDNAIVNRTAEFLVDHINKIVSSFRECAQLILAEIKDVQLEVPQEEIHKDIADTGVHDYVLVVRTEPGNAVFEATIRHIPKSDNLTVAGFVSRLNVYGSQSACISNFHLKLYCYCTS